jgi:hypothetical protein
MAMVAIEVREARSSAYSAANVTGLGEISRDQDWLKKRAYAVLVSGRLSIASREAILSPSCMCEPLLHDLLGPLNGLLRDVYQGADSGIDCLI